MGCLLRDTGAYFEPALLYLLVWQLRRQGDEYILTMGPKHMSGAAKPVVLVNDTRVDHHHGCSRVVAAIDRLAQNNGMRLVATSPAHADWRNDGVLLSRMESAAVIIVNGEGTIHHDRPAGRTLLEVGPHARRIGVPAVMVNCGWETNGQDMAERLADFSLVAVRDSQSARAVREAGVACDVVPDLSLYQKAPMPFRHREGVAFTDSVLRDVTLELEALRRQTGGRVAPIQFRPPGSGGAWRYFREYFGQSDLRHPVRLARLLGARLAQFRAQNANSDAYLAELAGLELLVSGRFHACTLALLAGTPFVAAGTNSGKIHALVADAGLAAWRVGSFIDAAFVERARGKGWSPAEAASLQTYLGTARSKADALFQRIGALA